MLITHNGGKQILSEKCLHWFNYESMKYRHKNDDYDDNKMIILIIEIVARNCKLHLILTK